MNKLERYAPEILIVTLFVILFPGFLTMMYLNSNSYVKEATDNGYEAAKIGIPANANPYYGSGLAKIWLNGYMKYKKTND